MKCSIITLLSIIIVGCATARPWTTEEKVLLGVSCLATAIDAATTVRMLDDGGWETNPIMGTHPSDSQVIIKMGTIQAITIIAAHYFEGFRSWILGVKTGINTGFAFLNERNH